MRLNPEEIDKLRKEIKRKREGSVKIYHEEMYESGYWQKNQHKGYKSFVQCQ